MATVYAKTLVRQLGKVTEGSFAGCASKDEIVKRFALKLSIHPLRLQRTGGSLPNPGQLIKQWGGVLDSKKNAKIYMKEAGHELYLDGGNVVWSKDNFKKGLDIVWICFVLELNLRFMDIVNSQNSTKVERLLLRTWERDQVKISSTKFLEIIPQRTTKCK